MAKKLENNVSSKVQSLSQLINKKRKDLHQELFPFLQVTQYNATVFHL